MDFKALNRQIVIWFGIIVAVYLVYRLSSVLIPFLISFGLAYLANPLINKIQSKRISRTLAVSIVFALIVLAILIILLIAIPILINQVVSLIQDIPRYYAWLQENLFPKIEALFATDLFMENQASIKEAFGSSVPFLKNLSSQVMSTLGSSTLAIVGFIASIVLIPMLSFYIMRDWEPISKSFESLIPRRYSPMVLNFLEESNEMLSSFLRGQFSVMLALAAVYSIGLSIVGLEYGVLIGVTAGLISFIPYLGASTGIVIALVVAWFQFDGAWLNLVFVGIVFGIGQALESFFLTPVLIGDKLGMHPIAVVFALMVGGSLFGFFGILLALPACAVLMVALRKLYQRYTKSDFYLGKRLEHKADTE